MRLEKSRRRDPLAFDYGGYMLVDVSGAYVVAGGSPVAYSLSLEAAEEWLRTPPAER